MVLLDAVPWEETIAAAQGLDLRRTRVVSVRAEPSVWNKRGRIQQVPRPARRPGVGQSVT